MMFDRGQFAILALLASTGVAIAEPAPFDTPDAAVAAVIAALEAADRAEVLRIFGPENEDILSSGDPEEDRAIWGEFLRDAKIFTQIEEETPGRATLYIGRERAPVAIEIALVDGSWHFDGEGAREELLMRQIGRNELAVIDIMERASEVQANYRRTDHDGDGVMEFAAAILSSPGNRDGLYWPYEPGTASSPFDETIARASFTGYSINGVDVEPEPLEGYYFLILQEQGPAAPGGAYSYMIGDNMVAGHALVAFPAIYGDSGVMSFMVSEGGIVYEADLGEDTLAAAAGVTVFNPDDMWTPVELED